MEYLHTKNFILFVVVCDSKIDKIATYLYYNGNHFRSDWWFDWWLQLHASKHLSPKVFGFKIFHRTHTHQLYAI